jgi:hypothetical protein
MRRLSVALERLLDPLDLAEPDGAYASRKPTGGAGTKQVAKAEAKARRRERRSRDSLFDRLAEVFTRLRWRQTDAVYKLLWSQATGYRVARVALTTAAMAGVACGLSIVVLVLTRRT